MGGMSYALVARNTYIWNKMFGMCGFLLDNKTANNFLHCQNLIQWHLHTEIVPSKSD